MEEKKRQHYIAPFEVVVHNKPNDCWVSVLGKVFDITPLIKHHKDQASIKPLLALAGKDLSHWFDARTGAIRHRVHPITGVLTPYCPYGPFPDVQCQVPDTEWRALNGPPWWDRPQYQIGLLTKRVAGKRDPQQEQEAQAWIETVIGERFPPAVPYEIALRDGIILCKLMNKLLPGIITKINTSGGDYKMMDNLSQFQKACVRYGVADVDLFQTTDLWDQKNIALVTTTIFAIGRTAYKHPEWRGPWLGPRPSEENRREFSEETLRAGEGMIGLQAGTNKGATQAGQNFGASRKIILGK